LCPNSLHTRRYSCDPVPSPTPGADATVRGAVDGKVDVSKGVFNRTVCATLIAYFDLMFATGTSGMRRTSLCVCVCVCVDLTFATVIISGMRRVSLSLFMSLFPCVCIYVYVCMDLTFDTCTSALYHTGLCMCVSICVRT
jgi:hypothetical protein